MANRSYMDELIYVIGHNESGNSYTSVNATEVVSIGIFNWYGARALGLARTIVASDPTGSQAALASASSPLYEQITSGNNNVWVNYVPGQHTGDIAALKAFLDLPASHAAQDALCQVDGANYASQAKSMGIVVASAQIYYADLYNQSPKRAVEIVNAAGGGAVCTLDVIHKYAMMNQVMSKYSSRRNWTYNELKSWVGDVGGGPDIPVTPPVNPPIGGGGNSGWEGVGANYTKDYIVMWNNHCIKFDENYPMGLVYVPSGNVYIPMDKIEKEPVTFVDTVDEMTDTSKIYVLRSDKHIWVYNGSEWVDTEVEYLN